MNRLSSAADYSRIWGITLPDVLKPYTLRAEAFFAREGTAITDTKRLRRLNDRYHLFRSRQKEIFAAAEEISKDDGLLLYCYFLYLILYDRLCCDPSLPLPEAPDRNCAATDFAPLFSFLFFTEAAAANMERRGLPFQVISDTLHGFEAEMDDYELLYGRPGVRIYINWFFLFISGELLRIGRLVYQIGVLKDPIRVYRKGTDVRILWDGAQLHRGGMRFGAAGCTEADGMYEAAITEEGDCVTGYSVNALGECDGRKVTLQGYQEILRKGDNIISLHIPALEPFSPEACDASLAEALQLLRRCYPDHPFRVFHCHSWMLEPRLREISGKDSNITRFCSRFTTYATKSAGLDILTYLFHVQKTTPLQELPEDSSLQRSAKAYLLSGHHLYEKSGIFPVPEDPV